MFGLRRGHVSLSLFDLVSKLNLRLCTCFIELLELSVCDSFGGNIMKTTVWYNKIIDLYVTYKINKLVTYILCLLGRDFHILIKNVSFSSPTNVGSHNSSSFEA